jgi:hypothetical protein
MSGRGVLSPKQPIAMSGRSPWRLAVTKVGRDQRGCGSRCQRMPSGNVERDLNLKTDCVTQCVPGRCSGEWIQELDAKTILFGSVSVDKRSIILRPSQTHVTASLRARDNRPLLALRLLIGMQSPPSWPSQSLSTVLTKRHFTNSRTDRAGRIKLHTDQMPILSVVPHNGFLAQANRDNRSWRGAGNKRCRTVGSEGTGH